MIPRKVLWPIVLGFAGVLIVTWRMTALPATLVIVNQTGSTLTGVTIEAGDTRVTVGELANSESRRLQIDPAPSLRLRFHRERDRVWTAPDPLAAGESLVLYITPGDHISPGNRIGTYNR